MTGAIRFAEAWQQIAPSCLPVVRQTDMACIGASNFSLDVCRYSKTVQGTTYSPSLIQAFLQVSGFHRSCVEQTKQGVRRRVEMAPRLRPKGKAVPPRCMPRSIGEWLEVIIAMAPALWEQVP